MAAPGRVTTPHRIHRLYERIGPETDGYWSKVGGIPQFLERESLPRAGQRRRTHRGPP